MFKKVAPDKWKHFFVGILMGAVLQTLSLYFLPMHLFISIVAAIFFVVSISYGFEVLSLISGKGHYEVMDAVAGTIGGGIGIVAVLCFKVLH